MLLYKHDWDETKRHFEAWWNRSILERPTVAFTAPRDKPLARIEPKPATTPEQAHTDLDCVLSRQEKYFAENRFFAEAFPNAAINLGAGSLAAYLGSELGFAWDTIWFEPLPELLEAPESVQLPVYDPDNRWWRKQLDMARTTAAAARGKYVPTIPDVVENIDILAAMRGPQQTLFDLYDRPEWVKQWIRRIDELYFEYYDRLYEIVRDENGGSSFTAFEIWGPGRTAKVQCDFSAMIGPDMFREFVVPGLTAQCAKLDYSVFHLDGPECIPHVQHLVRIEELDAIQWTPGSGKPPLDDPCWYDLYHQVVEGGKALLLVAGFLTEKQARAIAREVGVNGVYFRLASAASEAEGEDLLKRVMDW
jgi:5-methyltetrahydrofolate--homocysteine methyltransferase